MLIKVRVDNSTRSQILEAANLFRASSRRCRHGRALSSRSREDSAKVRVAALRKVLEPYGIKEIAQIGIACDPRRGSKSISDRINKN